MKRLIFILLCLLPTLCFAEFRIVDSAGVTTFDATTGMCIPNSTTLPSTCTVGELYMDTDATTGRRIYACESTNTWVLQGDGNSGGSPTWGTIVGTLSTQTDLQGALDGKATTSHSQNWTTIAGTPTTLSGYGITDAQGLNSNLTSLGGLSWVSGSAYNINPYTGATRQTATITVDGTNIIFTWTKTGTVASAVANILWEVN